MSKGFSLIEVLLSIVLIGILAGVSVPAYYTLFYRNDLNVAKNQIVQSLRRASTLSSASDGDTTWGVKIESGNIIIFKGINYAVRDTTYDEAYQISSSIDITGLTEVVFSKMTGFSQSTGIITLTSANGETKTIAINEKSRVSY